MATRTRIADLGVPFGTQRQVLDVINIAGVLTKRELGPREISGKDGNPSKVFSFFLMDDSGESVRCTAWGDNTDAVSNTLGEVGSVVSINNAVTKPPKYGSNLKEVGLSNTSVILPYYNGSVADVQPRPRSIPTPIEHLSGAQDMTVTLVGMVSSMSAPKALITRAGRNTTVQRVTLFDQTGSIEISFWGGDVNVLQNVKLFDTVLHLERMKIGKFRDLETASYSFDSILVFNPLTEAGEGMYKWYTANKNAAHIHSSRSQQGEYSEQSTKSREEELNLCISAMNQVTISDILNTDMESQDEYYGRTCATLSSISIDPEKWNNVCGQCTKPSDKCSCISMSKHHSIVIPVSITDSTGTIHGINLKDTCSRETLGDQVNDIEIKGRENLEKIEEDLLWDEYIVLFKLTKRNDSVHFDAIRLLLA